MGQINSKILHKIPYGMVWEHANYLQTKSWLNILGSGLTSAFVSSIINYSYTTNKSKIKWIEGGISTDFKNNLHLLFYIYEKRFGFITQIYVSKGGKNQEYLYTSVNRNTNLAIPGKVNFFELDAINYCAYNYYFKRFRKKPYNPYKKSLIEKKLPLLKNKLKTRTTCMEKQHITVKSNNWRILKALSARKLKPRLRYLAKKIAKFICRTPYRYLLSISEKTLALHVNPSEAFLVDMQPHFPVLDYLSFTYNPFLRTNTMFTKEREYFDSVERYDFFLNNPTPVIAPQIVKENEKLPTPVDTKTSKYSMLKIEKPKLTPVGPLLYLNPTTVINPKIQAIHAKLANCFDIDNTRIFFRSKYRNAENLPFVKFYHTENRIKYPKWVKKMLSQGDVSSYLYTKLKEINSYAPKKLKFKYYYLFPALKFMRAASIKGLIKRKKLKGKILANMF